ncbi:MAG: polysaccharide biosynthesis/export family protein [Bacteroidales bacterium]|nr:polysaccharide biosynthesis/export family protein [Bacteroidales bacterium]
MKATNMSKPLILVLTGLIFILISSCTSVKKLRYLQTESDGIETEHIIDYNKTEGYRLNKGDNLYIDITTSNIEFKEYIVSGKTGTNVTSMNNSSLYIISYQIDAEGYIHLPFIEPVEAYNKTLEELKEKLTELYKVYVTDVTVNVKLVNFNVTVLGEVSRAGQYFSSSNHLNLYEAVGMAGDLTLYGNRKRVKVMRLMPEGKYKIRELDITRASVIGDEFFELQPNDIVYVEPLGTKPFGFGTFPTGTILSAVTTLIVILTYTKK